MEAGAGSGTPGEVHTAPLPPPESPVGCVSGPMIGEEADVSICKKEIRIGLAMDQRTCQDLLRLVGTCQDWFRLVRTRFDTLGLVWTHPDSSKLVQTRRDSSELVQTRQYSSRLVMTRQDQT